MKKILSILLIALFVFAACGTTATADPCSNDDIKIGVVTDSGGVNDKSFNQGTWEGVQEYCTSSGIGAKVVESKEEVDYVPNLKNLTEEEGIEVIVAIGENLQIAVNEVASENPDTKYILIDGEPQDAEGNINELENVKSYKFNEQESGYLVGYIAGKSTKTNKVGFIGGMEITPVQKFGWGFVQGVRAANEDASVNYQYSGTFADSSKGKTIADTMYSSGVDIIFTAAGGTNDGVLNSAISLVNDGEEVYVIGVDRDMYEDGIYDGENSVILTSAMKNVGEAAKQGLTEAFDGTFEPGLTVLGFSDDGVGIPEENPNITDDEIITQAEDSLKITKIKDNKEDTLKDVEGMEIIGEI